MKEFLKKLIKKKEERAEEIKRLIDKAETADEVRSLGGELNAVKAEIEEARKQLSEYEEEQKRGLTPIGKYGTVEKSSVRSESVFGTLEYRMAFKDYVQKGVPIPNEFRAAGDTGTTVSTDLGEIIPDTIMSEFIKEASKSYGRIYKKVRKLNVKGTLKMPIEDFKAQLRWVTETTTAPRTKAGDIKTYVEWGYNICEIRVAHTLLSSIVALEMFESEIVRVIVEAYVEGTEKCIFNGTGSGQPLGILNDPRVVNVVTFTDEDICNWKAWRTNLFSKIPISQRGKGEFVFTAATVESCLLTMHDDNDRPLYREAAGLNIGESAADGSFFGRETTLVEPDVLSDFGTAEVDDVIGVYWKPDDYIINTQQTYTMRRFFDEDNNVWVDKLFAVLDGKIADAKNCWLIKKGRRTTTTG